jgi:hypothetical protein
VRCGSSWEEISDGELSLRSGEAAADLFSTWPWFRNLARYGFEAEARHLLLVVDERTAGPLLCLPMSRWGRGPAAPYGAVFGGLSNYYSSLYGPIGKVEVQQADVLRVAIRKLRDDHGASVIDFRPLDPGAPFFREVQVALRAEGYVVGTYSCFGNWHLPVAARSYADYEPCLPSRLRNTIRRGRKKLDAAGAWRIDVVVQPGPPLDKAIEEFTSIYTRSWKTPEPFPHFVPGLCRMAAEHGWLRRGVLYLEGRPIASQLWLVKDRQALIYKLAYDEEFSRYSAGSVLSAELMRRAIDEDQVADVDYLTGDDAYKVDWMSHRRERMGVLAFRRRSIQGVVALLRHRLGSWRRCWRFTRPPSRHEPASTPRSE